MKYFEKNNYSVLKTCSKDEEACFNDVLFRMLRMPHPQTASWEPVSYNVSTKATHTVILYHSVYIRLEVDIITETK
jgi:hypothetical protein